MLKYPLILVHGLFGFDKILGQPYWYKIPEALKDLGVDVHIPTLSAANDPEVRGGQLLNVIEDVKAKTGAEKVNLLGHSQGGITIRYAAGHNPLSVASLTTVSAPHQGSEIADIVRGAIPEGSIPETVVAAVVDAFSKLLSTLSGNPDTSQDSVAAADTLTNAYMEEFNKKYPIGVVKEWGGEGNMVDNGIYCYSWSGVIGSTLSQGPNILDPLYMILVLLNRFFYKEKTQNDGLVGRFSSHFGKVIKSNYNLDHADTINQLGGLCPLGEHPLRLYTDHVKRLAAQGL
ncbi:esterase/lipase family protein [Bartonella sp. DGB2]|uniref:esterase/lipase family protein n=1 Tax=Bartonella sp. DGB2 TaxID=3388426 RepID=UPI00398FC2B3